MTELVRDWIEYAMGKAWEETETSKFLSGTPAEVKEHITEHVIGLLLEGGLPPALFSPRVVTDNFIINGQHGYIQVELYEAKLYGNYLPEDVLQAIEVKNWEVVHKYVQKLDNIAWCGLVDNGKEYYVIRDYYIF